jgi:DNA-binding HxlR family transcriptional regulator
MSSASATHASGRTPRGTRPTQRSRTSPIPVPAATTLPSGSRTSPIRNWRRNGRVAIPETGVVLPSWSTIHAVHWKAQLAKVGSMEDSPRRPGMAAMADAPLGKRPCSAAAALELMGERWSLLIIREMGFGVHRFDQIASYTGAARDILANRLRKLETAGLVVRKKYSERPPRYEYYLTQAGDELIPTFLALAQWGDKWAVEKPSVTLQHECGHTLHIQQVCEHCAQPVSGSSVTPDPAKPLPGPAVRHGNGHADPSNRDSRARAK